MDASALRRGLPNATTRVLAATSRGPLARAAARVLVPGDDLAAVARATDVHAEAGRAVSWMPLMKPAEAADDILTARDSAIAAVTALAASGAASPDLTLDVGHFGVFGEDVTAGLLVVSLRDVARAARNAGVALTLTVADSAYIEAVYVIAHELRQDFPEVGIVLPTRLRSIAQDVAEQTAAATRVRLSTARLDPSIGTTSSRESGEAFVDVTKRLLSSGVQLGFESDDMLLLDIAASLVSAASGGAEVVVPYGTSSGRMEELGRTGLATRIVIPYGTHPFDYIAALVTARPSLAVSLSNPMRKKR